MPSPNTRTRTVISGLGIAVMLAACASTSAVESSSGRDNGVVTFDKPVTGEDKGEAVDGAIPSPSRTDAGRDATDSTVDLVCSDVRGDCDIVRQNCPLAPDGGEQVCVYNAWNTQSQGAKCEPLGMAQSVPNGSPCCYSKTGVDPCLKGLRCVGGNLCSDGVSPTGRCAPYCCPGDDAVCGVDKDGVSGKCSRTVVGGSPQRPLFNVCAYERPCRPLGVQPCPDRMTCVIADRSGSARCAPIYPPSSSTGLSQGKACRAANECAPGLTCSTSSRGERSCEILCYVTGEPTPFDSGLLTNEPGHGGCPYWARRCEPVESLFPKWLGICR